MLNYLSISRYSAILEFKYTHETDGCSIPRYRIFQSFERYHGKKSLSIEKNNYTEREYEFHYRIIFLQGKLSNRPLSSN